MTVLVFLIFVFKTGGQLSFCNFQKMNIENDLLIMPVKRNPPSLQLTTQISGFD